MSDTSIALCERLIEAERTHLVPLRTLGLLRRVVSLLREQAGPSRAPLALEGAGGRSGNARF